MATLSSCTLLPLNSMFRFNPVRRSFRTTIQCHRMNSHVSKWGKVKRVEFDRFRCFSINDKDGGDAEGESGNKNDSKSNVTTVLPEEDRGFSSDKSTTPSTSKRSFLGYLSMVSQADSVKLMELLGIEKVDPADVKLIKDKLFGISTFWVTKEEPFGDFGEGVLFIGNLRGKREDVFSLLQDRLVEATGDKYYLFMVEEPDSDSLDLDSLDLNSLDLDSLYLDSLYSNSPDPRGGPRVSFGLLRKELYEPKETTLCQYVIASLLFFLTIRTSVELGISSQINRLPPELVKFLTNPNYKDMELLYPALPVAYGVLGVLLFHEVGHFLAAFPKQVKLSIPFFIPHITLGSFGAITQFKSILPDRSTQVDISLAGPFAGTVLSFSMFAVGLLLSSNPDAAGDLVQVPSTLFQGSLLLGLISRATLGYVAIHAATVSIHPLVIAGWCGLTIQAFNMLPVGRLDGGRSVQGAFGKDALFLFSLTTYLLLGLGVLGGPLSLAWGCYVIFAQISQERPCLNDVTEVGAWRQTFVGVAIFLAVLTLLPVSDELADELGIGLDSSFHGYL